MPRLTNYQPTLSTITTGILKSLNPPPRLTVSEWAQNNRYLSPEASAEAGKWYNERAPHLVAPMDALSPLDPCQHVVCKFSSQTGKTEIILNFIGYTVEHDPAPMMVIQPNTTPMGEAFSKDRVAPMVRDTPSLFGKIADAKSRSSGNTLLHKKFSGGHLTIGGANSPAGLASRPIRKIAFDEIDRYEVTKEGDAVALATKRTQTFFNRKILKVSSPTYHDTGIDAAYQICEQQHELHLICPSCDASQMPFLRHFVWPKDEPENAQYVCEHCGVAHSFDLEDKIKTSAHWVQIKNDGDHSKGYWMNQFASPFARWGETIREFVEASKDPTKLQTVVNTAFAECWEESGEKISDDELMNRREDYVTLPEGVLVLVAAVDTQDDRLEVEVAGYGVGNESWGVEYKVFYGDPSGEEVWARLDKYLQGTYEHDSGHKLHIAATCIDSGGHHTTSVYDFCKGKETRRIFAIKGGSGWGRPVVSAPRPARYGRNPRPVKLFIVGVDEAKRIVHARLRIEEAGVGYCHFPKTYDERFFSQLSAEEIRTKFVKGARKKYWHQTKARNEALDLRAYQLAALTILDPDYELLAARMNAEPEEATAPKTKTKPAGRRQSYVKRY